MSVGDLRNNAGKLAITLIGTKVNSLDDPYDHLNIIKIAGGLEQILEL